MGKYGQLVMGPAGAGKSTYCTTMQKHCETTKRSAHVVNLDPAAEIFEYPVSIGIYIYYIISIYLSQGESCARNGRVFGSSSSARDFSFPLLVLSLLF